MALNSQHPLYVVLHEDWRMLRDLYLGERAVKDRGEVYLPPTAGMRLDGMKDEQPGWHAYQAYKMRAMFPDYVKEAVEALIGMMHQKPANFEVPDVMKPLVDKCTLGGEGLQTLLRRINVEQLTEGRVGLLADIPVPVPLALGAVAPSVVPTILPYIATYVAETIINWDEATSQEGFNALNLVVLDESNFTRQADGFTWKRLEKYRVLQLGVMAADTQLGETDDPATGDEVENKNNSGVQFMVGTFDSDKGNVAYDATKMFPPLLRGVAMESIPFVFINTKDIVSQPDLPPLLGLARLCLAIYRGEADYRTALFMSGQDTLVIIGDIKTGNPNPDGSAPDDALRVGAGSRINIDAVPGSDVKYVGVTSKGLEAQKAALDTDKQTAEAKAGKLIQAGTETDASGEALKTRITAQTATLNQIALAGAKGLENMLKSIATWMQLPAAQINGIKVTPNLEFADFALVAADIVQLMTARNLGAPISRESIHGILVDRGMTQMSFEDELAAIEKENSDLPPPAGTTGGPPIRPNPLDPNAPENGGPADKNPDGTPKVPPAKGAGAAAPAK